MESKKKITHIDGGENTGASSAKPFVPTTESKGKATQLRMFAGLLWLLAIVAQVIAIRLLFKPPVSTMWMIILIAIDLVLVIIGSVLWKRSNRLDPASEKDKFLFFMQNQMGVVVSAVAFLPLVIFILTSKNLQGKQKGILGGIAALALVIAGISSADFNPPSVEQYTEQTNRVEWLNDGNDNVYWTKSGKVYHLYSDCSYINTNATAEIFEGKVSKARELKNITELCSRCENRAMKEKGLQEQNYKPADADAIPGEEGTTTRSADPETVEAENQ
jgi:hypothetical protein